MARFLVKITSKGTNIVSVKKGIRLEKKGKFVRGITPSGKKGVWFNTKVWKLMNAPSYKALVDRLVKREIRGEKRFS